MLTSSIAGCSDDGSEIEPSGDLPLGDVSADDMKDDGTWGAALDCKPIPSLAPLANPNITISLDGLTLRLRDSASGYDRVFPVGVGAIDPVATSATYRESLTYFPLIRTDRSDFALTPSTSTSCKTWWTDPETSQRLPVFAGLPFMSFYGGYAIHGPIDNYRASNGGSLRRGYVSHGCVRMEAADVLEVYARTKGVANVPVHVQREPERDAAHVKLDPPSKWIGAECSRDSECEFAKGFCARNPLSDRGFCSARCTQYCADRAGQPGTFCVAATDGSGTGMCVPKAQNENFECRPYDQFGKSSQARFNQASATASVCTPASPGWVGDRCRTTTDCKFGTTCRGATATTAGTCSMACERYCADQPGAADTFCATVPSLGTGGSCVRQCTPSSNAAECSANAVCSPLARNGQASVVRNVCVPR